MADLTITIDAKTLAGVGESFRSLERNLAQLRQQLERTASSSISTATSFRTNINRMANALGELSNRAAQIGVALTAAMTGLGAALFKTGSQAIATEKAFTTLLGSAQRAQRLIETINREAAQSVLQYEDMLTAAQRLLAAGVRESDIIPTLRAIGDALAASGQITRENALLITKAITDIASKGKLQAQEMIQIANANVPVLKILREELKLTEQQFAEFMQGKRAVGAGDALRALIQGLRREYGGLQRELMQTPLGQISNLWDNLNRILRQVGTPLARAIVPALQELNNQLSRLVENRNLEKLAPLFTRLAQTGGAALNTLLNALVKLAEIFAALPQPIQTATAAFLLFVGPGSLVVKGVRMLIAEILGVASALRAVITHAAAATTAMRRFSAAAPAGLGRLVGVGGALLLGTLATASAQSYTLTDAIAQTLAEQQFRNLPPAERTPQRFQQLRQAAYQQAAELAPDVERELRQRGINPAQLAGRERDIAQAVRRAQAQLQPNLPATTPLFANLPNLTETATTATRARDPLAIQRAQLELARAAAALPLEPIAALIDAGRLEEARQRLARVRAELEKLATAFTQLRNKEEEQAIGRQLTQRERATLAELTRRELLGDVARLETQIETTLQRQNEQREEALRKQREQRAQIIRDINALQLQLERLRTGALPPEQQLQQLPAIHQRELAQLAPDLTTALLSVDPDAIRKASLQLAVLREQQTQEIARLQEQIAAQQAQRARELAEARNLALQVERQIAQTRYQAAIVLADAEIQNAQRQLQVLQQQGASRELLKAQQDAILNATQRKLQLEMESLQNTRAQLQTDLARLGVQMQLLSLLGDASLAQRAQLAQQRAQLELALTETEARLQIIQSEMRLLKQVADENNPFALWLATLQSAWQTLTRDLADAMLGLAKVGNTLKNFFLNLARDFLAILLRELLNPLYIALQVIAQRIAATVLAAFGVAAPVHAAAGAAVGAGAAAGLGALGGAIGAAGIAYAVAPSLNLNPTNAAVGAGVGSLIGGPLGAILGGLLGGLFGRRRASAPQVKIQPLYATGTVIRNDIRLYLDNREISRAIVQNAY